MPLYFIVRSPVQAYVRLLPSTAIEDLAKQKLANPCLSPQPRLTSEKPLYPDSGRSTLDPSTVRHWVGFCRPSDSNRPQPVVHQAGKPAAGAAPLPWILTDARVATRRSGRVMPAGLCPTVRQPTEFPAISAVNFPMAPSD